MIGGDFKATLVVLEDLASDLRCFVNDREFAFLQFIQEVHERNHFSKSRGKRDIFRLGCGQSDQGLHLGCPDNRTACVGDDIAGPRICAVRVVREILMPITGPISVHVALKSFGRVWFEE